jgi:predicted aldo/keto reductase-like oxidoreductase
MPCEQGVQIPGVLIFKGFAKRFSQQVATEWMEKAMQSVEECIECGECEEKCPYDLAIIDLLKENLSLYHEILKNGNA